MEEESIINSISNKSLYLKAFNEHFSEMLDDIERVIPNNIDLISAKNSLSRLRKANPKLIISIWNNWVTLKYQEEITNNNWDFFVEKNYKEDLSGYKHEGVILEGIERLRNTVRSLDEKSKEITIKYVQNLCKLSQIYSSN